MGWWFAIMQVIHQNGVLTQGETYDIHQILFIIVFVWLLIPSLDGSFYAKKRKDNPMWMQLICKISPSSC